jgi:hypothetical protein
MLISFLPDTSEASAAGDAAAAAGVQVRRFTKELEKELAAKYPLPGAVAIASPSSAAANKIPGATTLHSWTGFNFSTSAAAHAERKKECAHKFRDKREVRLTEMKKAGSKRLDIEAAMLEIDEKMKQEMSHLHENHLATDKPEIVLENIMALVMCSRVATARWLDAEVLVITGVKTLSSAVFTELDHVGRQLEQRRHAQRKTLKQ